MRGTADDVPLARRGEMVDEFWRRFSTVIREDAVKPTNEKASRQLRKTQAGRAACRARSGAGLMSLLLIAAAAGTGYCTHQTKPTQETAWMSLDRLAVNDDHAAEQTAASG
jgi:hypothetical protein